LVSQYRPQDLWKGKILKTANNSVKVQSKTQFKIFLYKPNPAISILKFGIVCTPKFVVAKWLQKMRKFSMILWNGGTWAFFASKMSQINSK
jgi:hypothetical protein